MPQSTLGLSSLVVLTLAMATDYAQAQLTICNKTDADVSVAIQTNITKGWWNLKPNECKKPINEKTAGIFVGLYTEPATRVRGINSWAEGAKASWCVTNKAFTLNHSETVGKGCPPGYYDAGFEPYQIQWNNVRWNLEIDPTEHARTSVGRSESRGRGRRVNAPPQIEPAVAKPKWVAVTSTTKHTLTSKSGRKEHKWLLASDSGFHLCSYRIREISNVGDANHYHLKNAYAATSTVFLSVKPAYINVGNGWGEIHDGSRASLDVEIDWYSVYVPNGHSWGTVRNEVSETLKKGHDFLNTVENWPVREAFRGSLWPTDLRCRDMPHEYDRERDSYPAPMPVFEQPLPKVAATLRVYCVRTDNTTVLEGAQIDIHADGENCEQARANALSELRRNPCRNSNDGAHPYRTNGPPEWLSTFSCPKPN